MFDLFHRLPLMLCFFSPPSVFPLIFYGVISTIRLFRPAHKGQTITSSPHIFEDMTMKHTEKLQAELDHLKKKLNFWFPDVNLWSNFALESHGKMCLIIFRCNAKVGITALMLISLVLFCFFHMSRSQSAQKAFLQLL